MKKSYLIPATEAIEIRSSFSVCGGGTNDPAKELNPGGYDAPKKRDKAF